MKNKDLINKQASQNENNSDSEIIEYHTDDVMVRRNIPNKSFISQQQLSQSLSNRKANSAFDQSSEVVDTISLNTHQCMEENEK